MCLRFLIRCAALIIMGCPYPTFAHGYITTERIAQHVTECIVPNTNTFQCARGIERSKLAERQGLITRKNGSLRVRLAHQTITLTDNETENGDTSVAFSYLGFDKQLDIHIIHVQRYEGDGYMAIHHRSGQRAFPSGYPIASPDGKKFLSISEDMFAGYNPNNIEIWKFTSGRITKVASFEPKWGPKDGDWLNSKEIRISKRCYAPTEDDPTALKPCGVAKIRLMSETWKLFE